MYALLPLLLACAQPDDTGKPHDTGTPDDTGTEGTDGDGDGYFAAEDDCNDGDAGIHPGAAEQCDSVDQDCDGVVDEGVTTPWYGDGDADGYGDPDALVYACAAPDGAVDNNDDCDDVDGAVHPGAPEVDCADPVDRNCDGAVGGVDGDGDGWVACLDCDDASATVFPAAAEACNLVDDDCDGSTDEAGATGEVTGYYDGDADGYGNPAMSAAACSLPAGYVADATDCNDGSAAASPAGTEACDTLDNDCDGEVDEEGGVAWHADADGDGYGASAVVATRCVGASGEVTNGADCDDGATAVSPVAAEVCDAVDNDCDGAVDEAGGTLFYADSDGDGYGDPDVVTLGCSAPAGYTLDAGDCDDTSAAVSPGAAEVCTDGIDQDCDGAVDQPCRDTVSHCGVISADETWDGEDVHLVTCDVYVQGSSAPRLTIADGADVQLAPGVDIYVGWGDRGELSVEGAGAGVGFSSSASLPAPGDWGGLTFGPLDTGSVVRGATIEHAGGNGAGAVYAYYTPLLTLEDTLVEGSSTAGVYVHIATLAMSGTGVHDSAGDGVYLTYESVLAGSGGFAGNTVSGCGGRPLRVAAREIGKIAAENVLSGNGTDEVYVYGSIISTDATIAGLDVPWYVVGDVAVEATSGPTVTVADGAELRFSPGSGLTAGVGSYGSLLVEGGAVGVSFTSALASPAPGDWDGIYLGGYLLRGEVRGATIDHAGGYGAGLVVYEANAAVVVEDTTITRSSSSGVYASWYTTLGISGSTLTDNADYGLYVQDTAALDGDGSFRGNVVSGNRVGVEVPAAQVGGLAADGTYAGNAEDDVVVRSDTVEAGATMRKLDVPWRVTGTVYVSGGAHPVLRVEDGAELRFDTGAGISVGTMSYGSLVLAGASEGVRLTSSSDSPVPGDWSGVYLGWYTEEVALTQCDIGYGGGNGLGNVAFDAAGQGATGAFSVIGCEVHDSDASGLYAAWSDEVTVQDTVVRDNLDHGVYLESNAGLGTSGEPTFTGNTLTGNGLYPLTLPAGYADQLDASSSFTGNGEDLVRLHGGYVTTSGTWQRLDVAYRIEGDVTVEASTSPVLTIEPGVEVRFQPNATLAVGTNTYGQLLAQGTPDAPIGFVSAQASPHAGDWEGLSFGTMDTGSVLSACEVRHGGSWMADIYVVGNSTRVTITDCAVEGSAGWGIYRYNATPTRSGITYSGNLAGDLY